MRSAAAWRWKNSWPGDAGRRAHQRDRPLGEVRQDQLGHVEVVVDDLELGDAGRLASMTRSGWLMRMPSTVASADAAAVLPRRGRRPSLRRRAVVFAVSTVFAAGAAVCAARTFFAAASTAFVGAACSRTMRCAPACRRAGRGRRRGGSRPSGVHSPNETSATSVGSTQWPRARRLVEERRRVASRSPTSAFFTARERASRRSRCRRRRRSAVRRPRRGCRAAASRCRCASLSGRSSRRSRTPAAACT